MESFGVFAFFPKGVADLKFAISDDGKAHREVTARRVSYFEGAGDYNFWKPVLYQAEGGGGKFLKIELTGEAQIGRVEIVHALK
jgi:hypothetical protein